MLYHAKNGVIKIDNTDMDYITFGGGMDYLVIIPGLGDGLQTVRGHALLFSIIYRKFAKKYKVYMLSRKRELAESCTTRDMAKDLATAMQRLGIAKADVLGVSQGGMIAQYLAIDYPEAVNKLVLAVTLAKPNETMTNVVGNWIEMAKVNDYKGILIDTAENSYTEKYLKKSRRLYPFLGRIGKPKDFSRFITMAEACMKHNSYDELEKITCQTLIIGGDSDRIVTGEASKEIAEKIMGSEMFMYKGFGHGTYEEAEDFNSRVLEFLDR